MASIRAAGVDDTALGADYQIILRDPFGTQLRVVNNFVSLDYARTVNSIGALSMVLADEWDSQRQLWTFDVFNRADNRIEVWRSPAGGVLALDMDAVWLVNYCERKLGDDGQRLFTVKAVDALDLLRRRCVLYAAGTSQAMVTALEVDDALKRIVRENLGSSATDTARDLSAYITVQADLGLGPQLDKSFAWRNVLTVIQDLAKAAATAGTYVAFDLVYVDTNKLEFRTYTGQRGIDRRWPGGKNPVLLDPEQGNIGSLTLAYDYRSDVTHVTAGGEGQGSQRVLQTASDAARMGLSPFHRIEAFVDARNSTEDGVQSEADAALRAGRTRRAFSAKLLQTPGAAYGVHYHLGDIVSANYISTQFNCRLDTIHITVADGNESIQATLKADELL